MTTKPIILVLLSFTLSACATSAGDGASLAGTKWRFTAIDGAPPVASETLLAFDERLSANVGCNGMSGPWRVEGTTLTAGPLVSTRMFCEGISSQEGAVSALLSDGPVTVDVAGDTLLLISAGHSATLARVP